jgi:hypothetical protein
MAAVAIIEGINLALQGIAGLQTLVAGYTRQAAILHAQGELSAEQLAEICQRAGVSDAQRDAEVAAAQQRLAGGQ